MRILITGASGFLGHHLVAHFEKDHEVLAAYCTRPVTFSHADSCFLDLRNYDSCTRTVEQYSPTHIVHCAAITSTDQCERDPALAHAVNVEGTRHLRAATLHLTSPPHITCISTDLVYDGCKGHYCEEDPPNPIQVYGQTKLQAEEAMGGYCGPHAIVRCALLYGPLNEQRPSFLDWMLKGIRDGSVGLFKDEYRTPVFVQDAAQLIAQICLQTGQGIFHCAGKERLSRYEFGLCVAEAFGLPGDNVRGALLSQTQVTAARPADVSLDIRKASQRFGYSPCSVREALGRIRASAR